MDRGDKTDGVGRHILVTGSERVPKDPEYLSTLDRGLRVLGAFGAGRAEMTLTEVAAISALSPAVVRRCLNTLVALGYVKQDGRRFLMLPKVLELADRFLTALNVEEALTPYLVQLRDETGDSASMAIRDGDNIMYLAHVSTNRPVRLNAHAGTRFPLHATSLGKALLAGADDEVLEQYLAHSDRRALTRETIVDAGALRQELLEARVNGYAIACDELDYGITSIAMAVRGPRGHVLGAVNCSAATSRVSREELAGSRLPLLRQAVSQIERSLTRYPSLTMALS